MIDFTRYEQGKIPLNIPTTTGDEIASVSQYLRLGAPVIEHMESKLTSLFGSVSKLVPSCTSALELAALTIGIKPGDEVIVPSYTFVGTANAFVKLGATPVFVDVDRDSLNLDASLLESAISPRTKAIVVVHYAGRPGAVSEFRRIADKYDCFLIEDAAQAIGAEWNGNPAGTLGDIGCISLGRLKNIQCDRGGIAIVNNTDLLDDFWKVYHNGTNRRSFETDMAAYYEWKRTGSNFYVSKFQAAFLSPQLDLLQEITLERKKNWELYRNLLNGCRFSEHYSSEVNSGDHNGHIFFIRCRDRQERESMCQYLDNANIHAPFHYIPLHLSEFGRQYSFVTEMDQAKQAWETMLRLPIYHGISEEEISYVANSILAY